MILPDGREKLLDKALEIVAQCRRSAGQRAMYYRALKAFRYTGSNSGDPAIYNYLEHHIDRMASYLFSPTALRFLIDFDHIYPKEILQQAEVASRTLTRTFERRDIDFEFGQGVDQALTYGGCPIKILWTNNGPSARLVMPWQFGVYREDINALASQEAMTETIKITKHDFWRRIQHFPNAKQLFRQACAYAKPSSASLEEDGPYLNQVLLSGSNPTVQTFPPYTTSPGGLMSMTADPLVELRPESVDEGITLHEITVIDDAREDYTTIQIVEPDILIAPLMKRRNFFVPEYHPYVMIQPNRMANYFWGRSELADMLKLQLLLRDAMKDEAKLLALQVDRLLGFTGDSTMTDEKYDQFKMSGWLALEPGADVKDLTPKLPAEMFAHIETITKFMDRVSGFDNVLSGEGEPGVRAGNHAQMLMRTASPRMRDRALLVERQCADVGDKVFELMATKEAKAYWGADGDEFLLAQIPEDRHVGVDAHTTSPIYEDDHMQVAGFLAKFGAIDGEDLIESMPINRKDYLKDKLREKQKKQAEFMAQHPELLAEQMHHGKKKKSA